jgi:hypothetical protein
MEGGYSSFSFHTKVRCLSRSKILMRLFQRNDEIEIFGVEKKHHWPTISQMFLDYSIWRTTLIFAVS